MAAIDLCTLDDVREQLQRQTTATEQDEVAGRLITRLSRRIAGYVERELAPPKNAATRTLEFDPSSRLVSVAPWDMRAVTAVVLDDGLADELTLTSEQWRLAIHDRDHGVWRALELYNVHASPTWSARTLTITGDWGFSEIPEEATQACVSAVVMYLRGEVQAFGSQLQPNSLGDGVNDDEFLPPGIRGMLAGLKLPVYA